MFSFFSDLYLPFCSHLHQRTWIRLYAKLSIGVWQKDLASDVGIQAPRCWVLYISRKWLHFSCISTSAFSMCLFNHRWSLKGMWSKIWKRFERSKAKTIPTRASPLKVNGRTNPKISIHHYSCTQFNVGFSWLGLLSICNSTYYYILFVCIGTNPNAGKHLRKLLLPLLLLPSELWQRRLLYYMIL